VWLIGVLLCLLAAANRGPNNCSPMRAMDNRIVRCGIISSCRSAVTSENVCAFGHESYLCNKNAMSSTEHLSLKFFRIFQQNAVREEKYNAFNRHGFCTATTAKLSRYTHDACKNNSIALCRPLCNNISFFLFNTSSPFPANPLLDLLFLLALDHEGSESGRITWSIESTESRDRKRKCVGTMNAELVSS